MEKAKTSFTAENAEDAEKIDVARTAKPRIYFSVHPVIKH